MIRFWKRIVFGLVPTILLLLATEICLRGFHFPPEPTFASPQFTHASIRNNPMLVADRDLVWKGRPDYHDEYVTLNNRGFRGPLPNAEKAAGRLVFFGDSVTFGWGLSHTSYVNELRRCVPDDWGEILNLSVPGYASTQGLILVNKTIEELRPDVVVATYLWNDSYYAPERWEPPVGAERRFRILYLGHYIKVRLTNRGKPAEQSVSYATSPEIYERNITEMNRIVAAKGGKFILLLHAYDPDPLIGYGSFPKPVESERYRRFAELMRETANREGIELIDLERELSPFIARHVPLYIFDGYHMSELGHQVVAHVVADHLRRYGLVRTEGSCAPIDSPLDTLLNLARRSEEINQEVAARYYWLALKRQPDNLEAQKAITRLRPDLAVRLREDIPAGEKP